MRDCKPDVLQEPRKAQTKSLVNCEAFIIIIIIIIIIFILHPRASFEKQRGLL